MAVIRKIKLPGEQTPRDIGVMSSNIIYDGDSGSTTTLNSKIQSIFTAIGDINSFEVALVNALPTTDIDDHTIYFVPNAQDSNVRDEYMYIDNSWEMIGSTTIDLSDYPTYDDISIVQGLTTGIPAATITVGATTTTLYAPEDTKVTQTDVSGSTENLRYPVLLSAQSMSAGTITDTAIKDNYVTFSPGINALTVRGNGERFNGRIYLQDVNGKNAITCAIVDTGTTDTVGTVAYNIGNSTPKGTDGNSSGVMQLYGQGNAGNAIKPLDNNIYESSFAYDNYLPMVEEAVLAAGVTTGVGSSTVPVYMASTGELLACSLPAPVTPPTYTMSMSGPTISLLADGVAASTITLPIYDGTVI